MGMKDTLERLINQWERETIPEELQEKISLLRSDLYSGPLYFNADGEECFYLDDGAKQLDFPKLAREVMDELSELVPSVLYFDLWAEEYFSVDPDQVEYEGIEESIYSLYYSDLMREVLGKELYRTIGHY